MPLNIVIILHSNYWMLKISRVELFVGVPPQLEFLNYEILQSMVLFHKAEAENRLKYRLQLNIGRQRMCTVRKEFKLGITKCFSVHVHTCIFSL